MKEFIIFSSYVSPEVLLNHNSGEAADIWALGCILFQFFAGKPPFKSQTEIQTFEYILRGEYQFPKVI